MLEWVTMGLSVAWVIAAEVLVNFFCDRENEILKHNLLLFSAILQVLAYLGLTNMSFLPHGNALIANDKYQKGSKEFQNKKESNLRTFALIAKLVCTAIFALIGLSQYIF